MIKNYICKNCDRFAVCKVNEKIVVFHEEAKKNLGVDITINDCKNFKSVNDDDE